MLIFLLRSFILGLIVAAILLFSFPSLRVKEPPLIDTKNSPFNISNMKISFNQAVYRAAPAVVNIYTRQYDSDNRVSTQGLGSGVIVSREGYIITNHHVIAKADQIIVALQDGRIANAQIVGSDQRTDIAILKITGKDLPVIPVNPHNIPEVGDVVLAIGNPYNLGQTTTFGIISATGRSSISADGRQAFIQTDAAINEGNSGGALINTKGELVGINTISFQQATEMETYGISFAVPYALAKQVMESIISDKRVIRGYIGVNAHNLNPNMTKLLGSNINGAMVLGVDPQGPAAISDIRSQDIIMNIDQHEITSRQDILDLVVQMVPNETVSVTLWRRGHIITLPLTVIEDLR